MITSKTPRLDLHGEKFLMVEYLVNSFINDNYMLKNEEVIIIHGKSTDIITNEVYRILKEHRLVLKFRRNNWNLGETIVYLKSDV